VPGLTEALLRWYDTRARDLPWRRTRDPYAIWVSEVMLQQTRVETVIPYYHRFLERFPTPRHLGEASVDAVLESWAGLGYYRRARALWLAAREVTDRHGGRVPHDEATMLGLSGVGP
jgi:A/G-specific adenine glycosylase